MDVKSSPNQTEEKPPSTSITADVPLTHNHIAILYSDAKREYFPTEQQYITEEEVFHRSEIVAKYLEKFGIKVTLLPGNESSVKHLEKSQVDLVLNLVDSIRGQEDLAPVIPAALELINIPYTGSGIMGMAINSNKFLTKMMLFQNGVPVPHFQLFNAPSDPLDYQLRFPLIAKLNEIHGSVEISEDSVVDNEKDLRKKIESLMKVYKQSVLVEEFVVGRELTVLIFEGILKKVYPGERIFHNGGKYKIVSFEAAWGPQAKYSYEKYPLDDNLKGYIKKAFDILKMDDYARFDIRVDEAGRYYFIDANANPAVGPIESDCAFGTLLSLYNVSFEDVLKRLIINTIKGFNGQNPSLVPNTP